MRLTLLTLALGAVVWSGCIGPATNRPASITPNVYRADSRFAPELRRVLVLPVTSDGDWIAQEGCTALQPVLETELDKTRAFELVVLSADQLRAITGQAEWKSQGELPLDFFARLRQATGCDALLFCQLTTYRPYPPLAIGWNLKLVDARQIRILWAADEVYDAGRPEVSCSAREYSRRGIYEPGAVRDPDLILESPRWFGQYAAAATLATLPSR